MLLRPWLLFATSWQLIGSSNDSRGNSFCWGDGTYYTFNRCCSIYHGTHGHPSCWVDELTFETCCGYDPDHVYRSIPGLGKLVEDAHAGRLDGESAARICSSFGSWSAVLQTYMDSESILDYALFVYSVAYLTERTADVTLGVGSGSDPQSCSVDLVLQTFEGAKRQDIMKQAGKFLHILFYWKLGRLSGMFGAREKLAAHCSSKNYDCIVYNPYMPETCFEHHPSVAPWQPECRGGSPESVVPSTAGRRLEISSGGEATDGRVPSPEVVKDWLGINTLRELQCGQKFLQYELTRMSECVIPDPELGLLLGEDYFESISMLQGVSEASASFTMFELGSAWGFWAVKAAVAWARLRPGAGPCHIVLAEMNDDVFAHAPAHLSMNNVLAFCNVTLLKTEVSARLLDKLLTDFGSVDLVHMDIQGAELSTLQQSRLLDRTRVQRMHVATHSRYIHRELRQLLRDRGVMLEFDFMQQSVSNTPFGFLPFDDGILAGRIA